MKPPLLCLALALTISGCAKSATTASGEATLDDLNRALSVMSMGSARPPVDVNELTNFPSIKGKSLPTPPAGKKLVIDQGLKQVVFADK